MDGRKIGLEVLKWLYGLAVSSMVFLFFCLLLDEFCFLINGGWNPLLGEWPIFSGTLGAVLYSSWGVVMALLLGLGTTARLVLWNRVPGILEFLVKHRP